jgi:hypothetical protein
MPNLEYVGYPGAGASDGVIAAALECPPTAVGFGRDPMCRHAKHDTFATSNANATGSFSIRTVSSRSPAAVIRTITDRRRSGSPSALLRSGPLRTRRAPLDAPGSSKP